MADRARRRSENVPGPFFVDETCIDCDTCRWMAPETFRREGGRSAVHRQPTEPPRQGDGPDARDTHRAAEALIACPTGSIGIDLDEAERNADKEPAARLAEVLKTARSAFPRAVDDGLPGAEVTYHCGFHSRDSFGAASWFVRHPSGNVLVDSPRYNKALAERIEALGGVRWMFLTHRDDVADHARWADHFDCERILHADDVSPGTSDVEWKVEGHEPVDLADGLDMIPVPGHTRGHMVLHDGTHDTLFTGDHLAGARDGEGLVAFRRACWYDWDVQVESMQRLLDMDLGFRRVLPGHGRPAHGTVEEMAHALQGCVAWMRSVA